ncbi:hypothetical protein [Pseudoalteromonas umbrosa]|uniref:hypothetical protein n=1 Tax=Pseudoalteromonas umbrosa TaxID=3048489 RepID=UPI0024C38319|nr:hypothetical protein [Pseudoalteromonas sp. B95]MDK1286274.1 hypothetical protein [Pseudoalteromonas sp. B95]
MKTLSTLLILFSFNTLACTCLGYDIKEAFNDYPIVFTGTVEKIEIIKTKEEGWFNYSKSMAVTIAVEQSYKGFMGEKVLVATREDPAACGFPFKQKGKYAVFAYPNEKGLFVGACSPTIHMEKREEYYEKERHRVVNFLKQKAGI